MNKEASSFFFVVFCPASGSRVGLVSGEDLCGCSGGASQNSPDAVLLQTLQGPGTPPSSRQHLLRLQGQPGDLPAGQSDFLLSASSFFSTIWLKVVVKIVRSLLRNYLLVMWSTLMWTAAASFLGLLDDLAELFASSYLFCRMFIKWHQKVIYSKRHLK